MKKSIKIISIALIILSIILVSTSVFATNNGITPDVIKGKIDTNDTNSVQTIGGRIIGIVQVVGNIVAIAMIIVLGIKYMMGSAEEKAEYKKTLFPYFIGAILIFAASNLAQMVYSWASTVQ